MSEKLFREESVTYQIEANYLLSSAGWLPIYGMLLRQAENGEDVKKYVMKACKRILEDLEDENE